MQLVAYGAQDIYLTGNPQITFFKVVYRRHTNFSMETIEQTINGTAIASAGGTGTVTISRNGDLVHKVYVTSSTAGIENGDELVSEVELEIGGQRIDRHYKEWNQIWSELSVPDSKALAFKNMTSALSHDFGPTIVTPLARDGSIGMAQVPLNFWFCRNPGLALPLIALQYHEVKLKFTWGTDLLTGATNAACKVMCDYIYLDTDERRRFAQVSHEYLIEQLQKQSATATASTKLNFNHPVKELIWTSAALNAYGTAQLKLNGHDRFSAQEEEYFQIRQPYDYHTAVPGANYSFADRPQMITPIDTGILTEADAPAATVATLAVASLTVHADTVAATTDGVSAGFRRGDVMLITLGAHDAALQGGAGQVSSFIVQIASLTATVLTFNTPLLAAHLGAYTDADGLSVRIIGRVQDPKSRCSSFSKKINVYSFALKPEEHQPSGTCNFSRIDNAKLDTVSALTAEDNIYAVNYNVLRIMSGMGGLAYSN